MFDTSSIPTRERVFCNRSLNMESIHAIGFDMDYTLAVYKLSAFEGLAYDETIKKLVEMGYPKELNDWHFDPNHMIRGLAIDKRRGNILKMDRHRYVKLAYHGFRQLSREERRETYDVGNVIIYEEPDFALVDTIFALPEAYLFAQLVELKENGRRLAEKTFFEIHRDIRMCLDICHQDGSIKNKVARNPSQYLNVDPYLAPVLEELKQSGRRLFLLTNSLWDHTNVVMSFLLNHEHGSKRKWSDYFDVITTGAKKPQFFNAKQVKLLHDMLGIQKGSEILYVGDHIYGDILRSKKEIGWRTMLVIEELEQEIDGVHYGKGFNSVWGQLMKTGEQNSRFSAQVENYACLYTSKLTNLRHYNTNHQFRAVRDYMPHDFD